MAIEEEHLSLLKINLGDNFFPTPMDILDTIKYGARNDTEKSRSVDNPTDT